MPYHAISKIVTQEDLRAVKAAIACIKANQLVLASLDAAGAKTIIGNQCTRLRRIQNTLPLGETEPAPRRKKFPATESYRSDDFDKSLADLVAAMEKLVWEIEAARPTIAATVNRVPDVFNLMRQAQAITGSSRRFEMDGFEARD
jgi:hypothetical protein